MAGEPPILPESGGVFTQAGGYKNVNHIARWDGSDWHAVDPGLNNTVVALEVAGADLYAGGASTDAGGNANADRIARWDGSSWHPLGFGLISAARAIVVAGPGIYVGGAFVNAGGNPNADYIARRDGSTWQPRADRWGRITEPLEVGTPHCDPYRGLHCGH